MNIIHDLCPFLSPLHRRRIGCGVRTTIIKTDFHVVCFRVVVCNVFHDTAVCQHGFRRHKFFSAGDHSIQFGNVFENHGELTLCRSQLCEQRFPKTTLFQFVNGQYTLRRNAGRCITLHVMPLTQHGHAAFSGCHKRGNLSVAVTVFHKHIIRRKDVCCLIGGKISVPQECSRRCQLFHRQQKGMCTVNIQCHSKYLLFLTARQTAGCRLCAVLLCP